MHRFPSRAHLFIAKNLEVPSPCPLPEERVSDRRRAFHIDISGRRKVTRAECNCRIGMPQRPPEHTLSSGRGQGERTSHSKLGVAVRMRPPIWSLCYLLLCSFWLDQPLTLTTRAEQWPAWRGPKGTGVSD